MADLPCVTPFEDMDDYLVSAAPLARIRIGDSMARTIARNSDVTTTEASEGLRQLPMPISASGISQSRLSMGKHGRHYLRDLKTAQAGGAPTSFGSGTPADIVAGGNLAAGLSYGDVTMAGVGTATSVCNGQVVDFGDPMSFLGSTTLGLMPADAIYIQEDPLGPPFTMALDRAQTPQELIDVLAKAPRNDQAVGELDLFGRRTQVTSTTTDPFGTVIRGAKYVQVKVKL